MVEDARCIFSARLLNPQMPDALSPPYEQADRLLLNDRPKITQGVMHPEAQRVVDRSLSVLEFIPKARAVSWLFRTCFFELFRLLCRRTS